MKKVNYLKKYSLITILFVIFTLAHVAYAIDYVPLERDAFGPGVVEGANRSLSSFLSAVFSFGIAVAVALALVEIIWGGIIKMTTDSWQGKSDANSKIQNAVYGLGVVLVCWLVLYTINPTLVSFSGNTFINPATPPKVVRNDNRNNFKIKTSYPYTKADGSTTTINAETKANMDAKQKWEDDLNIIIIPLGAVANTSTFDKIHTRVGTIKLLSGTSDDLSKVENVGIVMNRNGYVGNFYAKDCGKFKTINGFPCSPSVNLEEPYFTAYKSFN